MVYAKCVWAISEYDFDCDIRGSRMGEAMYSIDSVSVSTMNE